MKDVLSDGCTIRLVEDDIYSALSRSPHKHLYDRRVAAYDAVVSTWFYNRLRWGTSPLDYIAFAREALTSNPGGMLDAGCGSLLFTAQVYVVSDRQIIAHQCRFHVAAKHIYDAGGVEALQRLWKACLQSDEKLSDEQLAARLREEVHPTVEHVLTAWPT